MGNAQARNRRVVGAHRPVHVQGCESRGKVGYGYSEEFGVGVGIHQGSFLSPFLFIVVLEALSREFSSSCL